MLLAIDTATRLASLALYDPVAGRVLGEEVWQSVDMHTAELMPRVAKMMNQQSATPADLTGLVVSLGPGSFTGLRTGLSLAKGLALARSPSGQSLPLVGVASLDVVARPHLLQPLPIWAVLRAGRGRFCVGHYVRQRGRWRQNGPYQLTTLDKLADQIEKAAFVCGELEAPDVGFLRSRLGPEAVIATPAASLRRAAFLAELGWERLERGDVDDPLTLSPIYLHLPQID
jgi:tRNA threonylcarbamoyladenosine biosynthesis protein TsaB